MVAGCRSWGEDEQQAAEHQPARRGELSVEAVGQDRGGAGEAGRLRTGVEPGRHVDDEDDSGAERAERENDPSEAPPPAAKDEDADRRRQQRHRDEHEGVGVDRRLDPDKRRFGCDQPGVPRLADLDPAVVDELSREQAGRGGDDHAADAALRRQHRAGPGRGAGQRSPGGAKAALGEPERPEQDDAERPQPPPGPSGEPPEARVDRLPPREEALRPAPRREPPAPGSDEDSRLDPVEDPIDSAIDAAGPAHGPVEQGGPAAAIGRCYHRAPLGPRLLRGLPRAREGLFLAPISVLAGWLSFRSSPLQIQPLP